MYSVSCVPGQTLSTRRQATRRLALFVIVWLLWPSAALAQRNSFYMEDRSVEIQQLLSVEDWVGLKRVLAPSSPEGAEISGCDRPSPLRFLLGHAALASGDNSVAVDHFYCDSDSTAARSLTRWLSWTRELVLRRPDQASSHYLLGDALARSGELWAAKEQFDRAIASDTEHTLALNARGVVHWLLYESDSTLAGYLLKADEDFLSALKGNPKFADAWANRGLSLLRFPTDLPRAVAWFEAALRVDPEFWLALNGRAVALLLSGKEPEFRRDIARIVAVAPRTPFLDVNSGKRDVSDPTSDRARGFSADLGARLIAPTPIGIADVRFRMGYDRERGGVFITLEEGKNLLVYDDGQPVTAVGSYFTLNYPPLSHLTSEGK